MKASDFPDDQIQQAASNKFALYYRIGQNITVRSAKNRDDEWTFLCLTCLKTDDCAHSRAVRRYCNQPLERAA